MNPGGYVQFLTSILRKYAAALAQRMFYNNSSRIRIYLLLVNKIVFVVAAFG
jgi:hypothetical protein